MPAAGNKVFAPAIFFIAAREALEASLVIGILSGMLENLVLHTKADDEQDEDELSPEARASVQKKKRTIIRKLRKVVLLGALCGLLIAFVIGAAFLAVFYTQVNDLYGKAEELWEGIFNLIAVLLITPMSLVLLRAGNSKKKWKRKLESAFNSRNIHPANPSDVERSCSSHQQMASGQTAASAAGPSSSASNDGDDIQAHSTHLKSSPDTTALEKLNPLEAIVPTVPHSSSSQRKSNSGVLSIFRRPSGAVSDLKLRMNRGTLALFMIPLITTLREGLEGVVFIGGVSLGLPATSIPLPAIVGLAVGLLIGFLIFRSGNIVSVRIFLVSSTCFLLLIAAGMASRAVYYLQFYMYAQLVGDAAAESGDGPGSYNSQGYIWHFNCCNPEANKGGTGWGILNSLVGWNNTATYGSVFMYVGYWIFVAGYLWFQMWREGRLALRYKGKLIWQSKRSKLIQLLAEQRTAHKQQRREQQQLAGQSKVSPSTSAYPQDVKRSLGPV